MIRAEIEANNVQAQKFADENGVKIAQNAATGVIGVVIWPVWFAMDAKGAAATKLAFQMTEHPTRRRESDLHIVDWPTVALATAVVVLLIAACFLRWVSH